MNFWILPKIFISENMVQDNKMKTKVFRIMNKTQQQKSTTVINKMT